MADNIKIIGNIVNTTVINRYSEEDTNLLFPEKLQENFGGKDDYIEYYIYDIGGNLLRTNYNYLNYKLPPSTGLTPSVSTPPNTTDNIQTTEVGITSTLASPTSSIYPIIEIDPVQDLQNAEYSSGEFSVRYNLFQNILSNYIDSALFVKEISQDRTEVRLASVTLSDDEIEQVTLSLIDEINNSPYYVEYLLNFGNNEQFVAVNIALNKDPEGNEVLFKLYQPLPLNIQEKQTLWIVKEKVSPYNFEINLDKLITPPPPPTLKGPNFDIPIDTNQGTISSTYSNYSTLVSGLQSLQSSSYQKILNLLNSQSVQINVNYTVSESADFGNFVFFGSAYKRVENFYNKVKQIEGYNNFITTYTPFVNTTASLQTEINLYSSSINEIISQFDGFESYLYFESSSYTWPKSGSAKPFELLSTISSSVQTWYNNLTSSAKIYDLNNYNNLEYSIPSYVKEDETNQPFLTFLNMVGHYFDNIWVYIKSIPDINLANNNLNYGVSKDLVYEKLKSLGLKLYNSQAGESVDQFLIGANTGSSVWDNNFTVTGSYLNNIPRKDLVSELYKRIYHNLPYLLKTKGTVTGLDALITVFGLYTGIDGVQIGNQVWSAFNYQGTTYRNGDPILEAQSDADWAAANTAQRGAWCYYSGSYEYAKYGKLYNWYAVNDSRGFAPEGWHIPTITEWRILTSSLGLTPTEITLKLRASGSNYWNNNTLSTNLSGLTLVGNGTRDASQGGTPASTWTNNNQRLRVGAGLWAASINRFVVFSGNTVTGITIGAASAGIGHAVRFVKDNPNTYDDTDNLLNIREFGGALKSNYTKGYNSNKVRVIENSIEPGVIVSSLSPIMSLQTYPTASSQFRDSDMNYIDISFSPQTQLDAHISRSISTISPTWDIDTYIGDPRQQYLNSYPDLDFQRSFYQFRGTGATRRYTASLLDYNRYTRLVEFFDNSLFKMLSDFVPERTSLSTGVTFNSPILERNKVAYANPTNTISQSVPTAQYNSTSSLSTTYGTFYTALSSSNNTMGWYDGELSGSTVDINQYFEDNYNPYLQVTGTINKNDFNHSDWNILLNNVSQSVTSTTRQRIEYIWGTTGSLTRSAELQDSYLSLQSYNNSRYNGTKLTSLYINTYTSASYTGSDGLTIVEGDNSFGKTAVIDRYVRRIGLFTQIESSSFLLNRNNVALKYLVDEFGGLTELNLINNNWEDVQRTFVMSGTGSVSLFDTKQYSNQVSTNGDKIIFDSGYSYFPVFYYSTESKGPDPKRYFDSVIPQQDQFTEARMLVPLNSNNRIIGSINPTSGIGVPNTGPNGAPYFTTASFGTKFVTNLFRNIVQGSGFTIGGADNSTSTLPYTNSPTYLIPQGGQYKINVKLNVEVYSDGTNFGTTTFQAGLYRSRNNIETLVEGTSLNTKSAIYSNISFSTDPNSSPGVLYLNAGVAFSRPDPFGNPVFPEPYPNGFTWQPFSSITYPAPVTIGGQQTSIIYKYVISSTSSPRLQWSNLNYLTGINGTYYSIYPSLFFDGGLRIDQTNFTDPDGSWIYDFVPPSSPTPYPLYTSTNAENVPKGVIALDMSIAPPTPVEFNQGDKIIYKLSISNNTNPAAIAYIPTASAIYPQQFVISTLDTSLGSYPFTIANPYFISASSTSSLEFNNGLSNFFGGNYTFLPTFATGSTVYTSSLYDKYGDIDYPFNISAGDIFLVVDDNGRTFESAIKNITKRNDDIIEIELLEKMSDILRQQITQLKTLELLFLTKRKDETNVILRFKKRFGKTSYGFLIPENLAPDVLDNIDTITRQVKQKLLSDQQSST